MLMLNEGRIAAGVQPGGEKFSLGRKQRKEAHRLIRKRDARARPRSPRSPGSSDAPPSAGGEQDARSSQLGTMYSVDSQDLDEIDLERDDSQAVIRKYLTQLAPEGQEEAP